LPRNPSVKDERTLYQEEGTPFVCSLSWPWRQIPFIYFTLSRNLGQKFFLPFFFYTLKLLILFLVVVGIGQCDPRTILSVSLLFYAELWPGLTSSQQTSFVACDGRSVFGLQGGKKYLYIYIYYIYRHKWCL
jgi:hypothetical protein